MHSAGAHEESWELLRVLNFPGREHEDAVRELAGWARQHKIAFDFDKRELVRGPRNLEVIYVLFRPA